MRCEWCWRWNRRKTDCKKRHVIKMMVAKAKKKRKRKCWITFNSDSISIDRKFMPEQRAYACVCMYEWVYVCLYGYITKASGCGFFFNLIWFDYNFHFSKYPQTGIRLLNIYIFDWRYSDGDLCLYIQHGPNPFLPLPRNHNNKK